jgi:hypothetical protein
MEMAMKRALFFSTMIVASLALLFPAQAAKKTDKASSGLMKAATGGKHFPEASITARDASTGQASGRRQYSPMQIRK